MNVETLSLDIRERYLRTLERIAVAARSRGRDPNSVHLVVVTKAQPAEVVQAAVKAGARRLGENYPEEALEKMQALGRLSEAGEEVEWHMIGHVQSRKAASVVENFALVHSLDSLKLANRLERFAAQAGRRLPVLLEFNVSGEASKYGWSAWQEEHWQDLLPEVSAVLNCTHLEVRGLMTMPPFSEHPEASRPYFCCLRRLAEYFAGKFPQASWRELSMGTSADFEIAVQEGATLVRVGQAILGARPTN
jgi:pyridoxal phosphate enzyme (YggS family)